MIDVKVNFLTPGEQSASRSSLNKSSRRAASSSAFYVRATPRPRTGHKRLLESGRQDYCIAGQGPQGHVEHPTNVGDGLADVLPLFRSRLQGRWDVALLARRGRRDVAITNAVAPSLIVCSAILREHATGARTRRRADDRRAETPRMCTTSVRVVVSGPRKKSRVGGSRGAAAATPSPASTARRRRFAARCGADAASLSLRGPLEVRGARRGEVVDAVEVGLDVAARGSPRGACYYFRVAGGPEPVEHEYAARRFYR